MRALLRTTWRRSFPLQVAQPSRGYRSLGGSVRVRIDSGHSLSYIARLSVLIVTASMVAAVGYHSVILRVDPPKSDGICGRGKHRRRVICPRFDMRASANPSDSKTFIVIAVAGGLNNMI